jgi:murein DD-endopeptidase MepM/ murein hydrolase activator NlpD
MKKRLILLLVVIIAVVSSYIFFTYFERIPPTVDWQNFSNYLNKETLLKITASDEGQGLRRVEVTFKQGGKTYQILSEDYTDTKVTPKNKTYDIPFDTKKLRILDGEGILTLSVQDNSFWSFGNGNSSKREFKTTIDTKPPIIAVLSTDHVVTKGGTEIAVYEASPDTFTTGVKVGEHFFPGHKGAFEDEGKYISFFSYPYNLTVGEPLFIIASDRAGNTVKKNLPTLVKHKNYRKRTITLSDNFLRRKVPEVMSSANLEESGDLLEDFLLVNRKLREEQDEKIKALAKNSKPELMWEGGFLPLKNAKVESQFADFRTYVYKGNVVDKKYHLGYDLAATKRYPISASNSGLVVLTDNLGIYGNSVIIDHGFGISTLYAHMSSIDVNEGDKVAKGAVIGNTGDSGLAGGDHLHFGLLIHDTPVTPIEWWDRNWVKNRILRRLENAKD